MNETSKKNVTQAAVLIGLLVVLVLAFFRMMGAVSGTHHAKPKTTETASSAAPEHQMTDAERNANPSAKNMPVVPRSGDTGGKGMEIGAADLHLNPNQFKVFTLNPPKNPFVQKEEWYSDALKKLPGYPQLKNQKYLDSPDLFLPDLPLVKEHEWDQITADKVVNVEPTEISGMSKDGTISTHIQFVPKVPPEQHFAWSPATGIPVKALESPNWKKKYGNALSGPLPVAKKNNDKLLGDALGVPDGNGGDRKASDMLDGDNGAGGGDSLYCVGVSVHGKQASALIRHNGVTRIVREGSMLPTHYQVLAVKDNGVLVVDLRDGSSNWLPLRAAPAEQSNGHTINSV